MICNICPRQCNKERTTQKGFCAANETLKIARAALHFWEEPCISGTKGSGTIFFSGCNMRCVFCQNKSISHNAFGAEISQRRLKEIFLNFKQQGAHNINLVTPSHFTMQLLSVLDSSPLPVVWNSSAYEEASTLRLLKGKVDVFLPDFKFSSSKTAKKYANAENYPEKAKAAIKEMFLQTGPYKIDNGIMTSGVLIRHLILPENLENTYGVIDWISQTFKKGDVLFSLMSQYTPYKELPFQELNRKITKKEYILARNYMLKKGISEGFCQELSSAKEEYTPPFDLTGVF